VKNRLQPCEIRSGRLPDPQPRIRPM